MADILIADDHDIVRQGIRALLEAHEGLHVCAEATTGHEAVEKATALRPDLVILDVGMPEMNGLEAARRIRRTVPSAKILILTVHDTEQLALDFIEAGARGYLLKSDAGRMLVEAATTLINHGTFFSPRLQAFTGERPDRGLMNPVPPSRRLTRREREVLQLVAEGKSNKEVGAVLRISTKTAETHRSRLMAKLGVHSVADLVRYAIRNQIVEP